MVFMVRYDPGNLYVNVQCIYPAVKTKHEAFIPMYNNSPDLLNRNCFKHVGNVNVSTDINPPRNYSA